MLGGQGPEEKRKEGRGGRRKGERDQRLCMYVKDDGKKEWWSRCSEKKKTVEWIGWVEALFDLAT